MMESQPAQVPLRSADTSASQLGHQQRVVCGVRDAGAFMLRGHKLAVAADVPNVSLDAVTANDASGDGHNV